MLRFFALLFLILSISICSSVRTSIAQYMFLDSNGDGRSTWDDRPNWSGWTDVDVWLVSDRAKDGRKTSRKPAPIVSYEIAFEVPSGAVEWGRYIPSTSDMSVVRDISSDPRISYVRVECRKALSPGKHRLGRVRIRRLWGSNALQIIPCGMIGGVPVRTSFSQSGDAPILRFGPTVEFGTPPRTTRGEWFDVDQLSTPTPPPENSRVVHVSRGILYLDWHRMDPPYDLQIWNGRPAANGWALPKRVRHLSSPSPRSKSSTSPLFAASVVAKTFYALQPSDSTYRIRLIQALKLHPRVDSIQFENSGFQVFVKGSGPYNVGIGGPYRGEPDIRPPEPDSIAQRIVNEWATWLKQGNLLRIMDVGSTTLIGSPERFDDAVRRLQRGEAMTPEDSSEIRSQMRREKWNDVRNPPPLERVH